MKDVIIFLHYQMATLPQTQLHLDTSVLQVPICGAASPKALGPILRAAVQAYISKRIEWSILEGLAIVFRQ